MAKSVRNRPTMLIICPTCMSAYRLPADAVRKSAKAVRCAECAIVFDPTEARIASDAAKPEPQLALRGPAMPGLLSEPALRPTAPQAIVGRSRAPSRGSIIAAGALALLGLNMAGVAFRTEIAAAAPALTPVYAAIGLPVEPALKLDGIETDLASDGSGKVLAVEGRIANDGQAEMAVPNLRIVVRDSAQQSIYSWTSPAPQARIAPGEVVDFRSRLVAPPPTGHDVVVSFVSSSDMASGARMTTGP